MTLDEIKQTTLFKSYEPRVEKIWPGRSDDFALELMIADVQLKKAGMRVLWYEETIGNAFFWPAMPNLETRWINFLSVVNP